MVLTSTRVTAQTNGAHETHLLESGKAATLAELPRANDLKIVSYNIRWRSGSEIQQIARWLKEAASARPTIIGLQEVDRSRKRSGRVNHAKGLADSLGMYYAWTAPHKNKSETHEEETGVAILSPYPLTEVTRIVLPNPGPGGRLRVAIGATAQVGKTRLRVYSVHSETRMAVRKKVEQQQAILDDLGNFPKGMPAIILGDFNSWEEPAKKEIRKLYSTAGFETPFPDDESTFRQKIVLFDLKLKLDWIWVRGLTPTSYGIDRSLTVSDHFPLWTEVTFPVATKTDSDTPETR